jgi:quinol monooxygenase YgiN
MDPEGDGSHVRRWSVTPASLVGNGVPWRYGREMPNALFVVQVEVRVKPEFVEVFRAETVANASASLLEPGIARFDVLADREDPTRFLLIEVYRDAGAPAAHKLTAHYATWRDAVAPWMAEPRTSRRFVNVFPDDGAY